MPSLLFDPTLDGLTRALSVHQRRHEVIATNLANVETPGYRARDVDFASALKEAFGAEPGSPPPRPRVVEDDTAPVRPDGSTVDVDTEMAKLSSNGMDYVALARILSRRITLLRQAIEGVR